MGEPDKTEEKKDRNKKEACTARRAERDKEKNGNENIHEEVQGLHPLAMKCH